ncbi:membrane peptidoglycan carboxypeptidase [Microlunatus panaciterrae]|uniref:Membrane peptidoglycan carboxypeptidase n=1 Tax=Microlunatus panaciterrae TaxID=400768 RepID=A0ABS2RKH4_9ACTN|nr:membrane peptidoglycan carboxypeptidase [Microlunatus panaciterrae]
MTRGRKWAGRIFKSVAILAALCLVAGAAVVVIGYRTTSTPDANKDFTTNTTFVYYGDGKSQLGSFAIQNRQSIPLKEMPDSIKQAVVSAENRTFWTDPGFSISGMIRAAWRIARGGTLQGGSTITQQYIKIMYLSQDQTITRKFKELLIAAKVGRTVPKEKILEDYLNTIYFGRGAYGVQAASQAYFDIDAKDLTVPQAAVLTSVLNNPSYFDPAVDDANTPRLLERYRYVINSMAETKAITPAEAQKYAEKLPKFPKVSINERYGGSKGFLLKMVERELINAGLDQGEISGGGLKVITTFDKSSQKAAEKSAKKYTKQAAKAAGKKSSNLHAAIASVEVGTGEVLALYGGPDYIKNSRNWATTPRPAASTFKAFALAAGLKSGFSLLSRFNGNTFTPQGDGVPIRNEFSYQYGPVNLIKATYDSINTAFVDMTTQMDNGPKKIVKMAQALGAVRPKGGPGWDENSRIALGSAEVSPLNQANAYASLANDGVTVPAHVVREVRDAKGRVIYKPKVVEKRAVSKDISRDVTFALSNVVEQGTGRSVQTLNRPVAGKTGTNGVNNDITSAWFVAYTKQISTAVMYVAGDSGNEDLDKYARPGDSTFFGGTYPALTWVDFMAKATEGMPVKQFDPPAYVNRDKVVVPKPQPTRTQQTQPTTQAPTKTATSTPTQTKTSQPTTQAPTTQAPTTQAPTKAPTTKTTAPQTTSAPTTTTKPKTKQTTSNAQGSG